ncbi:uncharacterized protein LOC111051657 [Nilaparvata lugens]|uniref:uncharacterized protein LOC111051657 n=1 Tax=Nilaparvata lugens TaxID=108931 RepID=UPI00193D4C58|nr:uncharacterized protein LOC111051657 [Nilaparvata lugens]
MFQVERCLCIILFITSLVCSEDYKVRSISKTQYGWGHSPYWDVKSQTLYFVDIYGGSVISYKPSTRERFTAKIVDGPNATTGLIIPYEGMDDKFVVGVNSSVANITWDGRSNTASTPSVIAELTTNKTLHSHTGKADPKGRLWIGTIAQFYKNSAGGNVIPLNQGAEYMLSATGKVIERIPNITAPEGLVWSTNKTLMYFANCYENKIQLYDYDNESGDISNMRVIFDGKKQNVGGLAAGMVMDTEGKIWVAQFLNGTVIRIDADSGKVLRTLKLPATQLTNLVFGGENLDVLYVTSSQLDKGYIQLNEYEGRTFAITGLMSSGKPVTGYPGQRIVAIINSQDNSVNLLNKPVEISAIHHNFIILIQFRLQLFSSFEHFKAVVMMFQVEKILFLILLISTSVYGDDDDADDDKDIKIESISDKQFTWAHCPFWDETTQTLYFTDIIGGSVNSYKPSSKEIHTAKLVNEEHATVSVIIPFENEMNTFVVSVKNTVRKLTWDGESDSPEKLDFIRNVTDNATLYTHNGRADPMGRLWIGTLGPFQRDSNNVPIPDYNAGAVSMIDLEGEVTVKIANVSIPDGLAWSSDKTKLFFANAWEHEVVAYDYDDTTGDISDRRVIFNTKENDIDGLPSGLAMDSEEKLWVTLFFNGTIIRIDPESGTLLKRISLPALELSNLCFGGESLDTLYVTSGQILQDVSPPTEYSGRVFAVNGLMSSGKPITGYPGRKIVAI